MKQDQKEYQNLTEAYNRVVSEFDVTDDINPKTADEATKEIANELRHAEDGGFSENDRDDFNGLIEDLVHQVSKDNDAVNDDDAHAVAGTEIMKRLEHLHKNDRQFSDRGSDTNWEMEKAIRAVNDIIMMRSGQNLDKYIPDEF